MSYEDDDAVGYKKPPKSKRFKKGISGNPRGRPRGSRNFYDMVAAELNERATIVEGGKRRTISKEQTIVKQMVNKAAGGDFRNTKLVIETMREAEANVPLNHRITIEFVHAIDGRPATEEEYLEYERQQKLIESVKKKA